MRKALMAAWAILWCMALVIAYHTFQASAADFKLEGKKEVSVLQLSHACNRSSYPLIIAMHVPQ
jgi:hypothetical protein